MLLAEGCRSYSKILFILTSVTRDFPVFLQCVFLYLVCLTLPRSSYCDISICPGVGGDMKGIIYLYSRDPQEINKTLC